MTLVKICGITKLEDAVFAHECGADALGFIGVPESPRYIEPEAFNAIVTQLPPFAATVIVVRRPEDSALYRANIIQHYEESRDPSYEDLRPRIRAFRIKDEESLEELREYTGVVRGVHLDGYAPDKLGGTGQGYAWSLVERAKEMTKLPIVMSGGLTPENVADAVKAVRPHAVDVASGVERAPGVKNHDKVRAFIQAVRKEDRRDACPP